MRSTTSSKSSVCGFSCTPSPPAPTSTCSIAKRRSSTTSWRRCAPPGPVSRSPSSTSRPAAGVDFVAAHPQVAATVTPHHLGRHRGDLLADGLRPDLYCKPIINSPDDRRALVTAVTGDSTDFVFGTDSAPHPTTAKYGPKAAAGVFNAPYGVEVVAEVFHQAGALDRLEAFVSTNGAALYGVEPATIRLRLTRDGSGDPPVDRLRTAGGHEVVFFGVEEAALWRVERV